MSLHHVNISQDLSGYQEMKEVKEMRQVKGLSRHAYQPSPGGLRVDELSLKEYEEVADQEI